MRIVKHGWHMNYFAFSSDRIIERVSNFFIQTNLHNTQKVFVCQRDCLIFRERLICACAKGEFVYWKFHIVNQSALRSITGWLNQANKSLCRMKGLFARFTTQECSPSIMVFVSFNRKSFSCHKFIKTSPISGYGTRRILAKIYSPSEN